jgi:dCTP deaminase
MILTHNELVALVRDGAIENVAPEHINGASIDLTLADGFLLEGYPVGGAECVHLGHKETPAMVEKHGRLVLHPGDFALAATQQIFHLPDDVAAVYVLKSSMARAGLNHLNAGYCDPGWHGSALTMEFHNVLRRHTLVLRPGDKCGQMYFHRGEPVPELASYAVRGQYNGSQGVQSSKGVR